MDCIACGHHSWVFVNRLGPNAKRDLSAMRKHGGKGLLAGYPRYLHQSTRLSIVQQMDYYYLWFPAFIWTNAVLLSVGMSETNSSEILIKI